MAILKRKRTIVTGAIASTKRRRPVDPDRYMFFASRTQSPSGYPVDTTTINLTYFACRLRFGNAPYATRKPRFHFSGFCMAEGMGPQETNNPGNDCIIDGVTFIINGVPYEADFSGSPGVTIVSGSKGAWCTLPTFSGDIRANSNIECIPRWHVATVGQKFCGHYRIQKHRGEKYWAAADGTALSALIAANAATSTEVDSFYTVPPGNQTNSQLVCVGPDFMVAQGDWDGRPVALGIGDSIGYGRQEISASADERGNLGWFHKYLDFADPNYGRIPHFFMGNPSCAASRELNTSAFLRWDILDDIKAFNNNKYPFTVVMSQIGTIDANTTYSLWKGRIVDLITRVRNRLGPGIKVIQCTIPPQNSQVTGNLGFDASGFTVQPVWTNANNRGTLNTDIRTNNAFGHDGFIDVDTVWVDPANTDKFQNASAIGQLGTMISFTPGDGASVFSTGVMGGLLQSYVPKPGDNVLIEYQPATYATRLVREVVNNGDSTYTLTFTSTAVTVVQANAKTYVSITQEGVHPFNLYIDKWVVPRIPQSEKLRLAA